MADLAYALASLAFGFALAGSLTQGYQLLTARRLSFGLLASAQWWASILAVPLLLFAAPFIIIRNTIRGSSQSEGRIGLLAIATAIAGFWSLMSGSVAAAGWLELVARFA